MTLKKTVLSLNFTLRPDGWAAVPDCWDGLLQTDMIHSMMSFKKNVFISQSLPKDVLSCVHYLNRLKCHFISCFSVDSTVSGWDGLALTVESHLSQHCVSGNCGGVLETVHLN